MDQIRQKTFSTYNSNQDQLIQLSTQSFHKRVRTQQGYHTLSYSKKQNTKTKCKQRIQKIHGNTYQSILIPQKNKLKQLTKQERAEVQKIKNRQSAQRARDNKKIYITTLQNQVESLKQQNFKLQKLLQQQKLIKICPRCRDQNISLVDRNQNLFFQNDDYLQRVSINSDRSFSYLALAIVSLFFILSSASLSRQSNNGYIQSQSRVLQDQVNENGIKLYDQYSNQHQLNQCLLKLIKENYQSKHSGKKDYRNLRPAVKYNSDIIYCGQPTIFKEMENKPMVLKQRKSEIELTRFINLLLNGKQLKEIGIKGNKWKQKCENHQFFYNIKAQIISIVPYSQQCLI